MKTEDKERIEKDAEHEHKDQDAENMLVEMAATLNNLCRHYDQKNDNAMKFTMQKAYELSHKGIGHLRELDRLTEENADLREQLKQERNKAIDAAKILEEMVTASYVRLDCNGCLCNLLPAAEAVVKSIKRSSETLNRNTE